MDHAEEVEALPTAAASSLEEQGCSPRGKKRAHPEQIYAESISGLEVTWNDKDAVVTFLKSEDDCRLCLVGRAWLTCLEGDVKVLGYYMTQDMSVEVTSPSWSSFITVTGASLNARLQLVSIRPESDRPSFRLVSPVDSRPTVIPQSWSQAVDQISQEWVATRSRRPETSLDNTVTRRRARVVVCGAKGVGKSTCVRYTVNRLLKDYPQVAILDADVGQPELSPPGVLTLSVTTRPLLSPPHANLMGQNRDITTVSSLFFGCITHKVDPSRYMECLAHLIQQYEMQLTEDGDETQIPLVVNLDGWVKGMGYQVLTALLTKTIQASQVIQILGETRAKQFELSDVLCSEETKLHAVDACTNSSDFHNWNVVTSSIPPSALRELRLGAYFAPRSEIWDVDAGRLQQGWMDDDCVLANHIASDLPYCVPMEAVDYILVGDDRQDIVSESMILEALNGNIVGLCTSSEAPLECLGLGIVRSIDWAKRLFYILTPVDPEQLHKVKALVGGNLQLPLQFYFRGVSAESFPYMNCSPNNAAALGTDPMKSRNNITRRSNGNN
jgi:polynucleotide 5'-hydroxyl-kinase GRC3/NOL9